MSRISSTTRRCPRRASRLLLATLALVLGGLVLPAAALGSSPSTIIRQDVTGATVVCNGELLTVTSGTFQIVTQETQAPSGAYHVIVEGNAQGVKAVASSGARYQLPGGFWIELNATPGATTDTETGVMNVVGQGGAPDYLMHDVVHVTIDANGNVTAFVDIHTEATCVG